MFLNALANTENDALFEVSSIKQAILFLWDYYYTRMLYMTLVPFSIFFCCFITYVSYLYDGGQGGKAVYRSVLALVSVIYCSYQFIFEIKQAVNQGINYFRAANMTWNLVDWTSTIAVFAFCIIDLFNFDYLLGRVIGSIAVILVWVKLFYFLRTFQKTAAFIRMIIEIILSLKVFLLIFFLSVIAFANALYVLEGGSFIKEGR